MNVFLKGAPKGDRIRPRSSRFGMDIVISRSLGNNGYLVMNIRVISSWDTSAYFISEIPVSSTFDSSGMNNASIRLGVYRALVPSLLIGVLDSEPND